MTPGEKALLVFGGAIVASLFAYRFFGPGKNKFARWGGCAADVQQMCANPPGQEPVNTRIVRCLVSNHPKLTQACQQIVQTKYAALLERQKSQKGAVTSANRSSALVYTKEHHAACQKAWPKACAMNGDRNGDLFTCLSLPQFLRKYSDDCFGVILEIGLWNPIECSGEPMKRICGKAIGAFGKLDCAAYNARKFPSTKACSLWTQAAGQVAQEYRNRTKSP